MQFHLTKCRKNYLLDDKVRCSFDATHIVNRPEIEYHEKYCPARGTLDAFVYGVGETACAARDLLPVNEVEMPECKDDWDAVERNVNVLEKLQEQANLKQILRYKPGVPKAERKQFRLRERNRHVDRFGVDNEPTKDMPRPTNVAKDDNSKSVSVVPEENAQTNIDYSSGLRGRGRGRISNVTEYFRDKSNENQAAGYNQTEIVDRNTNKDQLYSALASKSKSDLVEKTTSNMEAGREQKSKILNHFTYQTSEEGFCSLPIPGTSGRGKRRNT